MRDSSIKHGARQFLRLSVQRGRHFIAGDVQEVLRTHERIREVALL